MNLIDQAERFVEKFLKDNLSDEYTFHNFNHTLSVVNGVKEIGEKENISKDEIEILVIAALFHDTGYIKGSLDHESLSVNIVTDFLKDKGQPAQYIDQVTHLIRATKYDFIPDTKLEKIIKDADYAHLAKKKYRKSCDQLRTEWELAEKRIYNDLDWEESNLYFLTETHRYYSEYALSNWKKKKEENVAGVKKIIKKIEEEMKDPVEKAMAKQQEKKKKSKKKSPERGIETFFRTTLNNHTRLSGIADSKANILLSVNAIIISIALSSIIPKLDSPSNGHLIVPTFIMLVFSVISIIFAILSTRPKVTSGVFTRQDIVDKKVNLLFFGNFYKMPIEEYEWAVNEMMQDRDYLYGSMTKDLYYLGLVLERKYKLLRITYNIFMAGIIISAIVFIVAFNMPRY